MADTTLRVLLAGLLGVVASASLNLGALIGLYARPSTRLIAAVTAFGAGALIEALSIELAYEGANSLIRLRGLAPALAFACIAAGFLVGGLTYFWCDRRLESGGGALRKPATAKRYLDKVRDQCADILHRLHLDHQIGRASCRERV